MRRGRKATVVSRRTAVAIALGSGVAGLRCLAREAQPLLRDDLLSTFVEAGAEGCMAVYEPAKDTLTLIGEARARRRFIPASTFKLANSVIALETGAVKDENEVIPYGGNPQPVKSWERDMPMREALALSAVPIYQTLAKRIGIAAYATWLTKLDYGNGQVGTALERFWLDGPLEISAVEQATFAARLALRQLPASPRSQAIVRDISHMESGTGATLFGKTGWSGPGTAVGWLTGWVEQSNGGIAAFSMNMVMRTVADAPKRLAIAQRVLATLDVG